MGGTLPAERAAVMRHAADVLDARHDEIATWVVRESGGTIGEGRGRARRRARRVPRGGRDAAPHGGPDPALGYPGQREPGLPAAGRRGVPDQSLGLPDVPDQPHPGSRARPRQRGGAQAVVGDTRLPAACCSPGSCEEAGLPAGVLNVVVGDAAEIGDVLVAHPVPRIVSFTGSTATGIGISRKTGVKKLLLELGGNAPMVILDDADLDYAVESAVFGSFYNSGQICMIANRIIVDTSIAAKFTDAFVERTRALPVGDPSDPATFIGPVISRAQLDSVQDKVRRAIGQGATLLLGGDPTGPAGLALPPQVLAGDNDVATAREEVFGPAITIVDGSTARRRRSAWPTTPSTACRARCTPPTPNGARASPSSCARA